MSAKTLVWQKLVPELAVSDFGKSLTFYTTVLGFKALYSREKFVYLELEDIQFMLHAAEQDSWQTGKLEPPFGRGITSR